MRILPLISITLGCLSQNTYAWFRDEGSKSHVSSEEHTAPTTVLELHTVTLTVQDQLEPTQSERHQREKTHLLQRLDRKKNQQDANHPRIRLLKALHGYSRYEERNLAELKRWKDLYSHVPKHQKKILDRSISYSRKLDTNEQLIQKNNKLCQDIVSTALEFYGVSSDELNRYVDETEAKGQKADRVGVSQALKHYVRDWSDEGLHERKSFRCTLDTLELYAPTLEQRTSRPSKVLLPGAGLGRLGSDIAAVGGYEVTINEWSMFMNVAYRFLEMQPQPEQHAFHPFVDSWSHHVSTADLQRSLSFPDRRVNSSVLMVEGDFTSAFHDSKEGFDFIVTHFFIDTARNLMAYLETIYATLPKGGYWINSGPLLYGTGPWVQLSLDEIIEVSEHLGFEFLELAPNCGELTLPEKKVRWLGGIYGSNERAINQNGYKVQFWVARKK